MPWSYIITMLFWKNSSIMKKIINKWTFHPNNEWILGQIIIWYWPEISPHWQQTHIIAKIVTVALFQTDHELRIPSAPDEQSSTTMNEQHTFRVIFFSQFSFQNNISNQIFVLLVNEGQMCLQTVSWYTSWSGYHLFACIYIYNEL